MSNKMNYYVIFNNGEYNVKNKDLITENDVKNIVYGPCTAATACLKADELEEEYFAKNDVVDTRYYFENMKYKATKTQSLNECKD